MLLPLFTYSGHKISTAGKTLVTVTHKGKFYAVPFQIVDKNVATILGSQSSSDMNMVSRIYAVNLNKQTSHDSIKDYAEVFEGLGCLEGEYKIRTDESICPVVHPPRKVPFAIKPKIRGT